MRTHRGGIPLDRKKAFRPTLELLEDRVVPSFTDPLYPGDKLYACVIGAPHRWAAPDVAERLARYQVVTLGWFDGLDQIFENQYGLTRRQALQQIRDYAAALGNDDIQLGLYTNPGGISINAPERQLDYIGQNNWFGRRAPNQAPAWASDPGINGMFPKWYVVRQGNQNYESIRDHAVRAFPVTNTNYWRRVSYGGLVPLGGAVMALNQTDQAPRDANGDTFMQWRGQWALDNLARDPRHGGELVGIDYVFFDNARVFSGSSYDFDNNGTVDNPESGPFRTAYQNGWLQLMERFYSTPLAIATGNSGHAAGRNWVDTGGQLPGNEPPPYYFYMYQGGLHEGALGTYWWSHEGYHNRRTQAGTGGPSTFQHNSAGGGWNRAVHFGRYSEAWGLDGPYSAYQFAVVSSTRNIITSPSTVWNQRLGRYGLATGSIATNMMLNPADTRSNSIYGAEVTPSTYHAIAEIPEFYGGFLNDWHWMGRPIEPSQGAGRQGPNNRLWAREFENALAIVNRPDQGDQVSQLTNVSNYTLPDPGAGYQWMDLQGNLVGATVPVQERDAVFLYRAYVGAGPGAGSQGVVAALLVLTAEGHHAPLSPNGQTWTPNIGFHVAVGSDPVRNSPRLEEQVQVIAADAPSAEPSWPVAHDWSGDLWALDEAL